MTKWLTGQRNQILRYGDPVCELNVDGNARTITASVHPEDIGYPWWYYVGEGNEVPPSGHLLEYSTHETVQATEGATLHVSARRPLTRRREYPLFISYRREDTEPYAWRLQESLTRHFGGAEVFMDQFSIRPGEACRWTIQQAAVHAKAVIALIRPKWATVADRFGTPRLESDADNVRRELTAAVDRGTLVVPLLVGRAALPEIGLPDELEALHDVQRQPPWANGPSCDSICDFCSTRSIFRAAPRRTDVFSCLSAVIIGSVQVGLRIELAIAWRFGTCVNFVKWLAALDDFRTWLIREAA